MVLDWKRDHPILRGLSLSKLYVGEAIKLDVPIETETLVEGLQGPAGRPAPRRPQHAPDLHAST